MNELIGPASPLGLPAPYWFIVGLKGLGFVLHMIPMHLWFAGTLVALWLHRGRDPNAALFGARFLKQLPILIALGVNFGIVPLLFVQVAYHQVFYPATILAAWPHLSIIVLLTVAYYGVYAYAVGLRGRPGPLRRAAGWVAALCFLAIGFLFTNAFSLMTNVAGWRALWERTSVAGAPLGIALNTGDPTLLPRYLMMLGLALTTVAAYAVADAAFFARAERDAYRRWVAGFAVRLATAGVVWFAAAGAWYVVGTWRPEVRAAMFAAPRVVLTGLTALAPGLPWLLIVIQRRRITPALATATAVAQVGVLGLNAASRQIVQNLELRPVLDVAATPVQMQWSPLVVFLLLFVAALVVVAWMVGKVLAASRSPAPARG